MPEPNMPPVETLLDPNVRDLLQMKVASELKKSYLLLPPMRKTATIATFVLALLGISGYLGVRQAATSALAEHGVADKIEELNASLKQVDDREAELSGLVGDTTQLIAQPGTIVAFWGKESPEGWLACDGKPIPDE